MKSLAHTPRCRRASERLAEVCLCYTRYLFPVLASAHLGHRLVFPLVPRLLLQRPARLPLFTGADLTGALAGLS